MTNSRAGSADTSANAAGSEPRFPSLDAFSGRTKRRLEILAVVTDDPLWKTRLGERFDVSVQTVGRDVDALHADGLLTSTIVTPFDAAHDQYIAYETTSAGEEALAAYRVCKRCGDVVDTRQECVHDYVPVQDTVNVEGGDR
jgi:predicted ArsR family transcriptional regulator